MDKKVNVNYLLIFNYVFLFVLLINIIRLLFLKENIKSKLEGGNKNLITSLFLFSIIFILLTIFVYGYYVYNVYQILLKDNILDNCDCLDNNLKYSLYTHAIILFFSVLIQIITLIVISYDFLKF